MTREATEGRGDGATGRRGNFVAPLPVSPSLIGGIPVANVSEDEAVAVIDKLISEGGSHYAAVVNAAKIVAADRDEKLKGVLREADLVTADGMAVVWASRLLGQGLKQRVTGIDLFEAGNQTQRR